MRLVFMGTPPEAADALRALHNAGHDVVLVVSQPDRKRGRSGKLSPTPVKAAALDLGLQTTHRLKDTLSVEADAGVVVQFGRLIKEPVLSKFTWLNLHPSLLPRWRGATPVESAILAGDTSTGICVMRIDEAMDSGPVFKRWVTSIDPSETSQALSTRLFRKGTELLLELLDEGIGKHEPQVGEATYCQKFDANSFRLDFSQSAEETNRLIRLQRAWTTISGKRLRILHADVVDTESALIPGELAGLQVGTGNGELLLREVQPENKAPMPAEAWINGARLEPGTRLG